MEHPMTKLEKEATNHNVQMDTKEFAQLMDEKDDLKHLRSMFFYPKMKSLPYVDLDLVDAEEDSIYLCGHSLGLQPKGVEGYMKRELNKWANMGVYGHTVGDVPWAECDKFVVDGNARLVGAKPEEIVVMNGLSVNIHLMMVSFYRPTSDRHKVLLESKAFPSDHNEHYLRTEDILETIEKEGHCIALIFFSGVQYYTGQLFDIKKITAAGQKKGCIVGWDLAHAAGNVPLKLHDWNVDFATWCSYKYLNSSCGGLGIVFVHERYKDDRTLPRFTGWWAHEESTRFHMTNKMELTPGAFGFRISNPPILLVCPMLASLDVFNQTTMDDLRRKAYLLTAYLEWLINKNFNETSITSENGIKCHILTPSDPAQRGCQLSLHFSIDLHNVYEQLRKYGVVCDKRLPYVLRVAPIHVYNNFSDVYRFVLALKRAVSDVTQMKGNGKV